MSKAGKLLVLTLSERFPQAFTTDPKAVRPLKIGIHQDLRAALPEVEPKLLRHTLANYTQRPAYLHALAKGLARVDLTGLPVAAVTDEQRAHARTQLETFKAAKKAKTAARTSRPPAAAQPEKDQPAAAGQPKMGRMRPVLGLKKRSA